MRTQNWFDRLPTPLRLGAIGLIGPILYGLLDPNLGFNQSVAGDERTLVGGGTPPKFDRTPPQL